MKSRDRNWFFSCHLFLFTLFSLLVSEAPKRQDHGAGIEQLLPVRGQPLKERRSFFALSKQRNTTYLKGWAMREVDRGQVRKRRRHLKEENDNWKDFGPCYFFALLFCRYQVIRHFLSHPANYSSGMAQVKKKITIWAGVTWQGTKSRSFNRLENPGSPPCFCTESFVCPSLFYAYLASQCPWKTSRRPLDTLFGTLFREIILSNDTKHHGR